VGYVRQSVGARAERKRQYAVRGDAALPGELRLITALLEDALYCFQRHLFARNKRHRLLYHEAEYWIMSAPHKLPFSFGHVCEVLGINPANLRYRLRRWREQQLAQLCTPTEVVGVPASGEAPAAEQIQCTPSLIELDREAFRLVTGAVSQDYAGTCNKSSISGI
jgi:hypothetical protein